VALVTMRVSMPDRPGMLAAVAAAVSTRGGDIVTIDVVYRADGLVVDDLCLDTGAVSPPAVRRELEAVPGVVVEMVRSVDEPTSAVDALELAADLAYGNGDGVRRLVDGLPRALHAEWAMALSQEEGAVTLMAASAGAPAPPNEPVPWLPLASPRRLATAPWMPTSWRLRATMGGLEVAASPLGRPQAAVAVARRGGRFRPPELRQIEILSSLAVRAWPAHRAWEASEAPG